MMNSDLTNKILSGVLTPEQPYILLPEDTVENYIELTAEEKSNIISNYNHGAISRKLLTVYKLDDIPKYLLANFELIKHKAMKLEYLFGELIYTSVFRSREHHLRIYNKINKDRVLAGLNPLTIPFGSKHLVLQAFDCVPKNRPISELHKFLTEEILEELGAWMEHPDHTKTWAHLQFMPYPSWTPEKSRKFHI